MRWLLVLALVGCGDSTRPLIQKVYEGTINREPIPHIVSVPELHMNSLPLIVVYVRVPNGGTVANPVFAWLQLNVYVEDPNTNEVAIFEFALLTEGRVEIFSGSGDRYRIIVAIEDPD